MSRRRVRVSRFGPSVNKNSYYAYDARAADKQLVYVHAQSSYVGWYAWKKILKSVCLKMDGELKDKY